jgi:prepilin-type N-terminal cleavage/methylation domain-containing protein
MTRRLRAANSGDAGLTLIELVVSMLIMSIFMVMFTGGILQMYRAANKTESATVAQAQVNLVFLRLDREVRYASGISLPGTYLGDWYVEYVNTSSGTAVCTGLRLNVASGQLQRRTWSELAAPAPTAAPDPTSWRSLASDVTSVTQPFTFLPADDTASFQRLELDIASTSGAGTTGSTRRTDITFTALNTSLTTTSDTVCSEGRSP